MKINLLSIVVSIYVSVRYSAKSPYIRTHDFETSLLVLSCESGCRSLTLIVFLQTLPIVAVVCVAFSYYEVALVIKVQVFNTNLITVDLSITE